MEKNGSQQASTRAQGGSHSYTLFHLIFLIKTVATKRKENKINHLLSKYSATIPNIPTPSQLTPGGSPALQTSGGFTRDSCTQAVYAQQIMALGFRPTRGRAVIETKAYCFLVAEIPRPLRSCICCSVNNSSFLRELTNVNKNTGFLRCIHQFTNTYIYSFITRLCIRKDNTSNG